MGGMVSKLNSGTLDEYRSVLAIEVYRLPCQFYLPLKMVHKSVWTIFSEIGL